jgi:hypothetical protein
MANPNPNPAGRWKPGQSGNPSGRPKGVGPVVRDATMGGKELVEILLEIARHGTEKSRITAATTLLAYAVGKPAEFKPIEEDDPLGLNEAHERLVGKLAPVARLDDKRGEGEGPR